MGFFADKLSALTAFDKAYDEFELTETEPGSPDEPYGMRSPGRVDAASGDLGRVSGSIKKNKKRLSELFRTDINGDVILRGFCTGGGQSMLIAYMNGMADDSKINEFILKPLMEYEGSERGLDGLTENTVRISEVRLEKDMGEAVLAIMDGLTVLFAEGDGSCAVLETHGYEKRAVSAAENEKVVLGPKESFTESFRTNVTLLRRIIHTDDLTVESRMSGGRNNTRLALIYREGFTNEKLIKEVRRRLDGIDVDTPLTSGILEQLIEKHSLFPVPRILSTERPDRAASHIMQGRVCLIVEGSPFALVLPITFFSLMNSPEDVYMRRPLGTVLRVVRYIGAAVSVMIPGYFLALALYHQGILTTEVLSTVIASRKMVFEPIGVEILLLLIIFQMIREAGQRVPGSIGQAIGIIGGLIMGQAAVTAHLASSVVLIIVAASGLGNFCIPDYSTQIAASWVRLAMLLAAWLGGLAGMVAASLLTVCLLADMKSFGVPFLSPFAPKTRSKRPLILRGAIGLKGSADDYMNTESEGRRRRV